MFVHIDIDSFFVSAERTMNSDLLGLPVAVGGRSNLEIFSRKRAHIRLTNDNSGAFVTPVFYSDKQKSFESFFVDKINGQRKVRGIITTSSYEARTRGVKTAMPIAQALSLCPELVVVPSNYLLYHRLSHEIHTFVCEKIPAVEQYSIDEFFGELSGWVSDEESELFAQKLQREIFERFAIPVSIGIARAKWTAKLATGFAKPYGVLRVDDIDTFIQDIPIAKFPGVGRGFQQRLGERGITKLGEIRANKRLLESWKKPGIQLYKRILGIDNESINPKELRKSIGISRTFDPIADPDEIRRRIMVMARHICYIAMGIGVNPTRYYLKINYEYGTRAKQAWRVDRLFSEVLFKQELHRAYAIIARRNLAATKISVSVSDFTTEHPRTLSLLDLESDQKKSTIAHLLHGIRKKFGLDAIRTGDEL